MKKVFVAVMILAAMAFSAKGQSVVRDGKNFKQEKKATHKRTADTLVTPYTFEDGKGAKHQIIINKSSGRCWIWKQSRNGNMYKQYMKEDVARTVAKEMNINYKTK